MVLKLSGINFCLYSFGLICSDNHILSLSMEFEKQNIIVTEWETEKVMINIFHTFKQHSLLYSQYRIAIQTHTPSTPPFTLFIKKIT